MKRAIGALYLRLFGWKPVGQVPTLDRYVLIAAPHTSNWDLPVMLAFGLYFGMKINWMGKHTLFKGAVGWLMRKAGGLPVDRRSRNDTVQSIADLIQSSPRMILTISPEGTRSRTEHWKSGFYHIALAAKVPVVCGVIDFARKEGGFGPTIELTGDVEADMDRFRAYYGDKLGCRPELFGPIRMRDETGVTSRSPDPARSAAASQSVATGLVAAEAPAMD